MGRIFVSMDHGTRRKWESLEETDEFEFLSDPTKVGEVILHNPDEPILEGTTDGSLDQYWAFLNGKHFATNYGLAIFFGQGTTHIVPPDRRNKGYVIVQLTDMTVDCDRLMKGQKPSLSANAMKMNSAGRTYRIDGTFEDIESRLNESFRIVGPEDGEMYTSWLLKMREEISRQRIDKIDDEFIARVNREYYSRQGYQTTKEELVRHFDNFGIY